MSVLTLRSRVGRAPTLDASLDSDGSAVKAAKIYGGIYPELPIPATQYVTASTALRSTDPPSVATPTTNAAIVNRANRKKGMISVGGNPGFVQPTPQMPTLVESSKFQPLNYGPLVNYSLNLLWYIAYPAASVMLGGMHNMGWSTKVPQLPTRTSGGPGPATMRQSPRFTKVQVVPRYSTMPPMYPTASSQG